jgi:hypothetical protein
MCNINICFTQKHNSYGSYVYECTPNVENFLLYMLGGKKYQSNKKIDQYWDFWK